MAIDERSVHRDLMRELKGYGRSMRSSRLREKYAPKPKAEVVEEKLTVAPEGGEADGERGSERPSDENGPHPDGCRCEACKAWAAGTHDDAGTNGLGSDDVDALSSHFGR